MRERMEEEIFRRSLYKVRQKRQFGKERGESKEAERKKEEKKCEREGYFGMAVFEAADELPEIAT